MSAEIIPFPVRSPAVSDTSGQDRLRAALASLDEALAVQRSAVTAWRRSLAELGDTMSGLRGSLLRYRGNLDKLEQQVGALNGHAVALGEWAEAGARASKE